MALAIDSQETSNAGHKGAAEPVTWAFNNAAGNLLVVGVVVTRGAAVPTVPTVTYNAVTMGSPVVQVFWNTNNVVAIYALPSPATGSNTVSISGSGIVGGSDDLLAGAVSFSGANVASPTGTTSTNTDAGGTGTHATAGNITAANGNYVLGVGGWGSGSAATPDQTRTFTLVGSGATSGDDIEGDLSLSSGSAINLGFTWTGADHWGMVAAEIKASGSAVAIVAPTYTFQAVKRASYY